MQDNEKTKEGYFDWLHSYGVVDIEENVWGENKTTAKSKYTFATSKKAQEFMAAFPHSDDIQTGGVFFDTTTKKHTISISENTQKQLKKQFRNAHPLTLVDVEAQLREVDTAISKIQKFDKPQTSAPTIGTQPHVRGAYKAKEAAIKVDSRIGQTADLLSNKLAEGWWEHAAASSYDIILQVYKATNRDILSSEDLQRLEVAQKAILQTETRDGKTLFTGGLKADANFVSYLKEEANAKRLRGQDMREVIRQDIGLQLDGGPRIAISTTTPQGKKSIIPNSEENALEPSFTQPRFFPDENGQSDTDLIIMQAGGMARHSSMRIIKKEKDANVPGGYRYFLTKVDAGGGLEEHDPATKTGTSIFTTEIIPDLKLRKLEGTDIKVVDFGASSDFPDIRTQKLNAAQLETLRKNPQEYQMAMRATLFALISAEREILPYKAITQSVEHGEGTSKAQENEANEWRFQDNKIKALRGKKVQERCKRTQVQLSGNCSVYSILRTVEALTSTDLATDILQESKQYDGLETLRELQEAKASLTEKKAMLEQAEKVTSAAAAAPPPPPPIIVSAQPKLPPQAVQTKNLITLKEVLCQARCLLAQQNTHPIPKAGTSVVPGPPSQNLQEKGVVVGKGSEKNNHSPYIEITDKDKKQISYSMLADGKLSKYPNTPPLKGDGYTELFEALSTVGIAPKKLSEEFKLSMSQYQNAPFSAQLPLDERGAVEAVTKKINDNYKPDMTPGAFHGIVLDAIATSAVPLRAPSELEDLCLTMHSAVKLAKVTEKRHAIVRFVKQAWHSIMKKGKYAVEKQVKGMLKAPPTPGRTARTMGGQHF